VVVLALPAPGAHASGQPPVTRPDAVTVSVDSRPMVVDLTANDTDPEGDPLFYCGTSDDTPVPNGVGVVAGKKGTEVYASSFPGPGQTSGAAPGTYVVDAVVCDVTSQMRSLLTITVLPSPGDAVDVARKRPGRVRIANGNDVPIRFFWGAEDHKHPDGRVDVPAHGTRTIHIERRSLVTVVLAGSDYAVGIERHLRPPTDGTALPPGVEHGHDVFGAYATRWVRRVLGA
jgi:hypothetical protein